MIGMQNALTSLCFQAMKNKTEKKPDSGEETRGPTDITDYKTDLHKPFLGAAQKSSDSEPDVIKHRK